MHSSRRMFMTIVRVLLPKISWKHKEGATLKGASTVPQNCRRETTAFANNIQEEVEGELQGQQRSSKDLWFLLGKKKKRRKRPRLEEGTSGLKREDIMFQIRHFYLQPKW